MRTAFRRRRPAYHQIAACGTVDVCGEMQEWQSRRNIGAYDDLPYEVRSAVRDCPFLVDITRAPNPRHFNYAMVVERIRAVKTFEDAKELDRWLLGVGLRRGR